MNIRNAEKSDKSQILKFCKNTFSWGDYIEDVWDYWISEGNLLVIEDDEIFGFCHMSFSTNQIWIEGIRINPKYRRMGAATQLIKRAENIAQTKNKKYSFMLIDVDNLASIDMAKKLNYKVFQTWNFYSLMPKQNQDFKIQFNNFANDIPPHYIKSWRWIPFCDDVQKLLSDQKIVCSQKNQNTSYGILTDSEHFDKTLIVTFFSSSPQIDAEILKYIQNTGFVNNYKRIQILCKEKLHDFEELEQKLSFYLMKKSLIYI